MLRQVVEERRPEHVVDRLGSDRNFGVVVSIPTITREIRVLHAPADTTFGTLVETMPESKGACLEVAGIASAGAAARRRQLIGGRKLSAATTIVGEPPAVPPELVQPSLRGGWGGCVR